VNVASGVRVVEPGGTIGILGGGQLGRMLAMVARRMGYRIHVVDRDPNCPTAQIADVHYCDSLADEDFRKRLARSVDVVTYEFEHLPIEAVEQLAQECPVFPPPDALRIAQHRILEKTFLASNGLPTAPFAPVRSENDIRKAVVQIGTPCVLKAATFGYDGKGQIRIDSRKEAVAAWRALNVSEAILEKWIDFYAEFSVLLARDKHGNTVVYPPIRNWHRHHILAVSVMPCDLPKVSMRDATKVAKEIAHLLQFVGVLCVEFFIEPTGHVLVNEIAPRPHNSGHLTIEACVTSQFEQQLRAICGLPLGAVKQRCPAAMANLLGDLWLPEPPLFSRVCQFPGVYLHLYGKVQPAPGRKMGHITALASTAWQALRRVRRARRVLRRKEGAVEIVKKMQEES